MKKIEMKKILVVIFLLISCTLSGAEIKVGIARKDITPPLPFWLSGYERDKKSSEIVQPLWAKAAVFEESPASMVVIVTTDILGLSHEVSEVVARRVNIKYGITRSKLLMNSSHTHSGPVIWPNLGLTFNLSPEYQKEVSQYSQKLADDLVELIGMAMNSLEPMKISSGHG